MTAALRIKLIIYLVTYVLTHGLLGILLGAQVVGAVIHHHAQLPK